MSIWPILKMGDLRLLGKAGPVQEFGTPELISLIEDMFETMYAANGAGLAASQIGIPLQVMVLGFEHNPRYPDAPAIPKTVLINPTIRPIGDEIEEEWEGCLSVPGMRGVVPRWAKVHYEGFDAHGAPVSGEASGFHARVIQHEYDHMRGILYPMRIKDMALFGFVDSM
jgi:peptide deformylase